MNFKKKNRWYGLLLSLVLLLSLNGCGDSQTEEQKTLKESVTVTQETNTSSIDDSEGITDASLTILLLSDSLDAKKIVEETLKNLMRSEGILIALAFDAQGAYLESVLSLGLCEKSLSRNTEVAVAVLL